jgi:hypothetical protein
VFCPKCRDEFRPGFTRCASCDVDLVQELGGPAQAPTSVVRPSPTRLVDFCGFFSLEEARTARDELRERRIRTEIVVREAPDAAWDAPVREEYWLRVDPSRLQDVEHALTDEASEPPADFSCSECGQAVATEERFCPRCGARFEAD